MKIFISTALLIINIVLFILTVLFAVYGIYDQIMGPANAEKLLKKWHISLRYNQVLVIGVICVVLMFLTYILRAKLFGRL